MMTHTRHELNVVCLPTVYIVTETNRDSVDTSEDKNWTGPIQIQRRRLYGHSYIESEPVFVVLGNGRKMQNAHTCAPHNNNIISLA